LGRVKAKGIHSALVSSTSLYSLRLVDELYHISDLFDVVITEADTELHKPDPDPYLKALKRTAANPLNTIVIEDSPNGIISAKKAGCFTYGLTSSFKSHILMKAGADDIIESYEELIKKLKF
jgi:beta-phosphoglucomutase-like phosphatase (HAD superfamily)